MMETIAVLLLTAGFASYGRYYRIYSKINMINGNIRLPNPYLTLEIAKIGQILAEHHHVWGVFVGSY